MGLFLLGNVDLGVREVGEAAGVARVAVGQNDVPHVSGRKPECFDPADGGVRLVELEAGHVDERLPQPLDRVRHVPEADAGIDEGEAFPVPQQQAVADDRRVRRDQERPAVDVVNRRHTPPSHAFRIADSGSGSASR